MLQAAGHELIDWDVSDHPDIVKTLIAGFVDFGSKPMLDLMQPYDEPIFGAMKMYEAAAVAAGNSEQQMTPTKLREMNMKRNALCKAYLDKWQATGNLSSGKPPIDCLIAPATPWAAVREGFTNEGIAGNAYFGFTAVYSLLDLPVCTFPVSKVNKDIDERRGNEWSPLGDLDARIQADYDPVFYDGAPISLQLVGERLGEEKVLEMVKVVKDALDKAGIR